MVVLASTIFNEPSVTKISSTVVMAFWGVVILKEELGVVPVVSIKAIEPSGLIVIIT